MWVFLLSWCALSVLGTVVAVAMIRAGKRQAATAGAARRVPRKH
ncbi:MAG: hypothetical protein PW845_14270 [Pseudomonas sp.]|nr:hypothetical protein [Pseudomonas sp. PIA16]MDE1166508.1 hypothetical protein [Pseudomonas sp.]